MISFPSPAPRSDGARKEPRARSGVLSAALILPAMAESLRKLDPRVMIRNPVMFVVEVVTVLTTILLFRDVIKGAPI